MFVEVSLVPIPKVCRPPSLTVSIKRLNDFKRLERLCPCNSRINAGCMEIGDEATESRNSSIRFSPNNVFIEPNGWIDVASVKGINPVEGHGAISPIAEVPMMVNQVTTKFVVSDPLILLSDPFHAVAHTIATIREVALGLTMQIFGPTQIKGAPSYPALTPYQVEMVGP